MEVKLARSSQRFLEAAIIHEIGHQLLRMFAHGRRLTPWNHSYNPVDYMCNWWDLAKLHLGSDCSPAAQEGFADRQLWRVDPYIWYTDPQRRGPLTAPYWIGPAKVERAFEKKKAELAKLGIDIGRAITGTVSPIAELGSSFVRPRKNTYYEVYTNALLEEFPGGTTRAIWGKDARIFPKGVPPLADLDFDLMETLAMQFDAPPIFLVNDAGRPKCLGLKMRNLNLEQRGSTGFIHDLENLGSEGGRYLCTYLLENYEKAHPGISR